MYVLFIKNVRIPSFIYTYIVVCNPPCVQGACVANGTCNCAEGYIGERCTEPGNYVV